MKVMTCNVNGIRSASTKGFWDWVEKQHFDLICLQEVRAKIEQIPQIAREFADYSVIFNCSERPGYSGVALYYGAKPDNIDTNLGFLDTEGRFIKCDFGDLSIISVYFPSGTSGDARQAIKYEFLEYFEGLLREYINDGRKYIICGDLNIAHKKIDLKNWQSNQNSSGFLPDERAWMDKAFNEIGFIDAFREINKEPEQYTWWSNRARAWERNVGWRIDYQIVTPNLKDTIKKAEIYRGQKFSDHAPLIIEYDI